MYIFILAVHFIKATIILNLFALYLHISSGTHREFKPQGAQNIQGSNSMHLTWLYQQFRM